MAWPAEPTELDRQGELDTPNGPGPNCAVDEGLRLGSMTVAVSCPLGLPSDTLAEELDNGKERQGTDGVMAMTPVLQIVWPGSSGRV